MSTKTNKAIVRRYFEQVWHGHQADLLPEFWHEDFLYHEGPTDLAQLKTGLTTFLTAFPDLQTSCEDMIAEGDKVTVRWTFTATHRGEYLSVPGTGKQVKYSGMTILRLANGQFVEAWVSADNLGLMQQLGVLPTPEAA